MQRTTALGVFVLALAVVFVTASAPGVFAQDPKGGGGGGEGPRGGGGGAGGGAGAGAGNAGVSGGSGGVSSGSPGSAGSSGGGTWSGGGASGGSYGTSAGPRGGNRTAEGGSGRQPGAASPRWSGGTSGAGRDGRQVEGGAVGRSRTDDQMAGRARFEFGAGGAESSAPWYSRPRGSNPATGTAVARPDVPVTRPPGGGDYPGYPIYPGYPGYPGYGGSYWGGYYDCYYYPYGCGNPWGYGGFGVGYFYYSPFGWNYGDYAGWGGGGGGGGYSGQQMGSIRLKVKPNTASVYVDGYYAGTVDDFDNSFQKLSIALGSHRIEISAPGYQPLVIEIDIRDFDTVNYEGQLEPIR